MPSLRGRDRRLAQSATSRALAIGAPSPARAQISRSAAASNIDSSERTLSALGASAPDIGEDNAAISAAVEASRASSKAHGRRAKNVDVLAWQRSASSTPQVAGDDGRHRELARPGVACEGRQEQRIGKPGLERAFEGWRIVREEKFNVVGNRVHEGKAPSGVERPSSHGRRRRAIYRR